MTPASSPQNVTTGSNNVHPQTLESFASDANETARSDDGQNGNSGTNFLSDISSSFILFQLL